MRLRSRLALALLLGVAALAAAVLVARWRHEPGPTIAATVRELQAAPDAYRGRAVTTTGVVRLFDAGAPDAYAVLEEAGQYRVGLRGVPVGALAPCVGRAVRVAGTVGFQDGFGLYLRVARLAPVTGHASSPPCGRAVGGHRGGQA